MRMRGQRCATHRAAAGYHIEYPVRDPRFAGQFRHAQHGQRRGFRRFDDDRATRRQGRHHFPHPDHQREVPRDNPGHHANRLFARPRLVACALRQRNGEVEGFPRNFSGQPGGIAHPVEGTADFKGAGNVDGLALLQRFKLGQLLAVLFHQIGEMEQDPLALRR